MWCPYNHALAKRKIPFHTKPPQIPADLGEFVKPCWIKLCAPDLRSHCVLSAKRKSNKVFHSIVWKYCHKEDFSGLVTVRTATLLASLTFNKRMCSLIPFLPKLGALGVWSVLQEILD